MQLLEDGVMDRSPLVRRERGATRRSVAQALRLIEDLLELHVPIG